MKKLVSVYALIAGTYIVYRDYLKDLWAHVVHEDFYLGAAVIALLYMIVQTVTYTITGGWIGG